MKRRRFHRLLGAVLGSTPLPSLGQTTNRPTVGVLVSVAEDLFRPHLAALRKGLADNGLVDGDSIRLVVLYADARLDRLADLARELKAQGSWLIIAGGTTATSAAKRAAPGLPIVMAGSADPVMMGFARSMERPGGRITGIAIMGEEVLGERFRLLKEVAPAARTFAAFLQAANPGNPVFRKAFANISQALGVRIDVIEIAAPLEEFPDALDRAVKRSAGGALVAADPLFDTHRAHIFRLVLERRLPSVVGLVTWARAGALLAYAPDLVAIWSQSAYYVSEILRGSDPATLPIEQATATQLAINRETARTLDIAIPPPILARADEVIEASG
jgi:putative ABC transport system substrate-binding protein